MLSRINALLDTYVLPWPVRFLTFRFVILATIALLIPLIVFAERQVFVLLVNSYLNVMSVAVSSIVLLYATISEARQQRIAEVQELRAQEDHTHVTEMHNLVLQALANQHEELQDLRELIAEMHGKQYIRKSSVAAQTNARGLHPRGTARFTLDDSSARLARRRDHQNGVVPGDRAGYFLELFGVASLVGMVFVRQITVGFFNVVGRCALGNPQNFVVILGCHNKMIYDL